MRTCRRAVATIHACVCVCVYLHGSMCFYYDVYTHACIYTVLSISLSLYACGNGYIRNAFVSMHVHACIQDGSSPGRCFFSTTGPLFSPLSPCFVMAPPLSSTSNASKDTTC